MRIAFHLVNAPTDLVEYAPLGFGYLAAFLRRHEVQAKCSVERRLENVLTVGPDIVGISCSSQNYGLAVAAARLVRQRSRATIILGGPHISLAPETLDPAFDCGVIGEGEDTFLHLMRIWEQTGALSPEHLADVRGIVYRRDGVLTTAEERPPIEPLDDVPPPDRAILAPTRFVHLMTGRGCPHACRFCAAGAIWGPYRAFSAERVAAEIMDLIADGHRRIHFFDDLFIADPERLIQIADILEDEGDLGTATFSCTVRADLITETTAELLTRLGVQSVTFGLESADDETQERLGKGFGAEQAHAALALLDRYDIECHVSAIVGEPDETAEGMRRTYSFLTRQAARGRLAGAEVHVLSPYPGAGYWKTARERGLVGDLDQFDWARLGAPWRGLLLNDEIAQNPARLINWDYHLRRVFAALQRPTIMLAPDDAELDLDADPRLLRAIYLQTNDLHIAEMLEAGDVDVARFSIDELRLQLSELVERQRHTPLVMFAPDPAQATIAVMRALKLALTLEGAAFIRPRFGPFPLATTAERALEFTDARLIALIRGEPTALPAELTTADLRRSIELPADSAALPIYLPADDLTAATLLDRYAAMIRIFGAAV